MKKKKTLNETATITVDDGTVITSSEADQTFDNLSATLVEIRKCDGILGYILRSPTSATIDLKEPSKIIEYAILSSQITDSSSEISNLFNLGEVENIIIEGKEIKMLLTTLGTNKISIFMEKTADHADVLMRISQ